MASRRGLAERTTGINLSPMSQLVFDWLDEIFDDTAVGVPERETMVTA